jgi:hypothetical protein
MNAYSNFFDNHVVAVFRAFFAVATVVDLVFIYAAFFDRELPRHIAKWFFGTLSGHPVVIAPSAERTEWWQWLAFSFVSAVPLVVWVAFEVYTAKHST